MKQNKLIITNENNQIKTYQSVGNDIQLSENIVMFGRKDENGVNRYYRAYYMMDNPLNDTNRIIEKAILKVKIISYPTALMYSVHTVKSKITSNQLPTISTTPILDNLYPDNQFYSFDITKAIIDSGFCGIMIKATTETSEATGYAQLGGSSYEKSPILEIYLYEKDEAYYQDYEMGDRNVTKIDLINQDYTHVHSDAMISHNTLSIPLKHIYESRKKYGNPNKMGKGWKSNLHQYLIKNDYNEETKSREINYVDGEGIKHTFEEKWYYEENGEKHYIDKSQVYLDNDQKLKYISNENSFFDVKYEIDNKDKLKMISASSMYNYNKVYQPTYQKKYYIIFKDGVKKYLYVNNGKVLLPRYYEHKDIYYGDKKRLEYNELFYLDGVLKGSDKLQALNDKFLYLELEEDQEGMFVQHSISSFEKVRINIYCDKETFIKQEFNEEDYYLNDDIIKMNLKIKTIEENIENAKYDLNKYEKILDNMYSNQKLDENSDIKYSAIQNVKKSITGCMSDDDSQKKFQKEYDERVVSFDKYSKSLLRRKQDEQNETYVKDFYNCLERISAYQDTLKQLREEKEFLIKEQRKQVNDFIVDEEENTLGFDGYGRLILIQDKEENKIQIEYGYEKENEGRILSVYSETESIRFNYDKTTGLLKSMVDPQGRKTKYNYDSNENLVSIIYNNQKETKFEYKDGFSVISPMLAKTKITEADNEVKVVGCCYDGEIKENTVLSESEELKVVFEHSYTFDETNVLFKDELLNEEESYTFDEGRIIQQKNNKETSLLKYEGDNLIQEAHYLVNEDYTILSSGTIYPDAGFTLLSVDGTKLKSKSLAFKINLSDSLIQNSTEYEATFVITNQEIGKTIEYVFVNEKTIVIPFWVDFNDYQHFQIDFTGFEMNGKYNNPTTLCDVALVEPKDEILYEYDTKDRLVLKKSQEESMEYLDYDEDDLCHHVKTIDKYNEEVNTYYSYNANKQLTLVEDSKGNVEEYSYDEKGNCIEKRSFNKKDASLVKIEKLNSETDGKDKVFTQYDKNTGELLSISTSSKGMNNATSFTYNYGLLTSMMHHGMKVNYAYDGQGRKMSISLNGSTYVTTTYADNCDRKIVEKEIVLEHATEVVSTYKNGYKEENLYDKEGQLRKQNLNDETSIVYDYDKKNRLVQTTYSDDTPDVKITYEDDKVKELTKGNYTHSFTYDEKDRILYEQEKENQNLLNDITYFYQDDELVKVVINEIPICYQHDVLNRVTHQEINHKKVELCHEYSYLQKDGGTQDLIAQDFVKVNTPSGLVTETYNYEYDDKGNIISIDTDDKLTRYQYDSLNRLVREDNPQLKKTMVYKYDTGGNILLRKTYNYNINDVINLTNPKNVDEYAYQCNNWKDQLISFNGKTFVYDTMGRPTTYKDTKMTWNKNGTLASIGDNITYTYNANGIRTKKVVDGVETTFLLDGTRIVKSTTNNVELIYRYVLNKLVGFCYNNIEFIYERNILGDIIRIYNSETGEIVGEYAYDGYGNQSIIKDVDGIATLNPFRYRGYFFDSESNLFYLNSRYYDSEVGRFISPDIISILDETKGQINGLNLYMYCADNPISYVDPSGYAWWSWIVSGLQFTLGLALTITGIGTGIGLTLMGYGAIGFLSQMSPEVGQLVGGFGTMGNGISAVISALSLFDFGSIGIVSGLIIGTVGLATTLVGINDVVTAFTGINYIQKWTGMNDNTYGWLNIGLNLASGLGQIATPFIKQYASNKILNSIVRHPEKIAKYNLERIKKYGNHASQWVEGALKEGNHKGQGYTLTHIKGVNEGYIQWHPGNSTWHKLKNPYFKISSNYVQGRKYYDTILKIFFIPS